MKKSRNLVLVGAAAILSAASVFIYMWMAGIVLSTLTFVSVFTLLISWLKISSVRRRQHRMATGSPNPVVSAASITAKVIQKMPEEAEKITA